MFLILVSTGLYVFASERTYVHRYIFPGVATMFIFIVFPLSYTIWIAFTNYSATNILTFERARTTTCRSPSRSRVRTTTSPSLARVPIPTAWP